MENAANDFGGDLQFKSSFVNDSFANTCEASVR